MDVLGRLEKLQLVVVTGKGGVGKSVVTAALGRLLATRGRKVLLFEVDPRENLHQLLDTDPSGGEIVKEKTQISPEHGFLGLFRDPSRNLLGVWSRA